MPSTSCATPIAGTIAPGVLLLAENGATPSAGTGAVCVRLTVASANAPPSVKFVPRYCVSAAGFALIAEILGRGHARARHPAGSGHEGIAKVDPVGLAVAAIRSDPRREHEPADDRHSAQEYVRHVPPSPDIRQNRYDRFRRLRIEAGFAGGAPRWRKPAEAAQAAKAGQAPP
jgi:hypothetical protein